MTSIRTDREAYSLTRRYLSKKGKKPLKGFALDLTIRFNTDGVPFLQDHNGELNTMPFQNVDQMIGWLGEHIKHNHDEHYAAARS
jgi:hypothetical protein